MEQEFEAAGVPMSRRGAGFEEHLLAMRAVWGPDPVSFAGRYYRIPEADIGPKPVLPGGLSVVVGAASPSALQRAGRLGQLRSWASGTSTGTSTRTHFVRFRSWRSYAGTHPDRPSGHLEAHVPSGQEKRDGRER
jgi:alkanesulfonate monooxygenase SsuD/methylene tetrahydromethanopterin reductase-like flavin-dependent oxidoreductase (luciferase family)